MTGAHVGGDLADQAEQLLRRIQRSQPTDIGEALGDVTATAVDALETADYAGITVAERSGRVSSLSSTGPYPSLLDEIQERHGEGPCLSAAWENHTVRIDDLLTEARWPLYCRSAAASTPIRSVMSYQMFSDNQTMGALNFYAERPGVFDEDAVELGLMLATHAALTWNLIRRDEQFRSALASRDIIGQAKGLIMERYDLNALQAFELLRRLSQDTNVALVDVANRLVEDRTVRPPR